MAKSPIWFIRHARSYWNHATQTGGPEQFYNPEFIDALLHDEGYAQIAAKRAEILALPIEHIYVSPYRRALQTCEQIFGSSQIPVTVCPLVAEQTKYTCDVSVHNGTPFDDFTHYDWSMVENKPFLFNQLPQEVVEKMQKGDPVQALLDIILERKELIEPDEYAQERCRKFREMIEGRKNIAIVSHYAFIYAYTGVEIENVDVLEVDNSS